MSAILTSLNMFEWRIPLTDLDFDDAESSAVQRVLSGKWLSMGPEVAAFEHEFAQHHHVEHAIAVSNATAALHLSLSAVGVGPGDEVIQPALNFVAAANMTVLTGATPVFADILGLDEATIDPDQVRRLVSPRTKAIVAMHYGGRLCRMNELIEISQQHGLALIEDACHAVGVVGQGLAGKGAMAGGIGDVGTFSFFSNKNLATGEGGMVVTHRDDLARKIRLLRSHGMTTLTWDRHRGHARSYDVELSGFNYRIDEMRAALGRVQLGKLSANNDRRRQRLRQYVGELRELTDWIFPLVGDSGTSGHLMVAVAPSPDIRERVVERLRAGAIQSSLHYPCLTDFTAFRAWRDADVPATRDFSQRAMSLPIYPTMTEAQVQEVCGLVKEAARD